MKKIMLISFWSGPVQCAATNRIESFIKFLKKEGWKIVLVSADYESRYIINHGQYHFLKDYSSLADSTYRLPGLDVIAFFKKMFGLGARVSDRVLKKYEFAKINFFKKIVFYFFKKVIYPDSLYFFWYLLNRKKVKVIFEFEKPDVIFTSALPISCHYFGAFLRKKFGVPWAADFRDLFANNMSTFMKLDEDKKVQLQKKLLTECSFFTTVSEKLKEQINVQLEKKLEGYTIYNGFDDGVVQIFKQINEIKKHKKISFIGTLYSDQYGSLEFFLNFYKKSVFFRNWKLEIVGSNDKQKLISLAEKYIKNEKVFLTVKEAVPREMVGKLYTDTSLLIHFDFSQDGNLSSKIFEYFSTGIPVALFTLNEHSELAQLVRNAGGIVVAPSYETSKIEDEYNNYAINKEFLSNFSREKQVKNLSRKLLKLI